MVWRIGNQISQQEAEYESTKKGELETDILYAESDGVWIHLQREKKNKAEVKVAVIYDGRKNYENLPMRIMICKKSNSW